MAQVDAFINLLAKKEDQSLNIDEWIAFAIAVSLSPAEDTSLDDSGDDRDFAVSIAKSCFLSIAPPHCIHLSADFVICPAISLCEHTA